MTITTGNGKIISIPTKQPQPVGVHEPVVTLYATSAAEATPELVLDPDPPPHTRKLIKRALKRGGAGVHLALIVSKAPGAQDPGHQTDGPDGAELARTVATITNCNGAPVPADEARTRAEHILRSIKTKDPNLRALLADALASHASNIVEDMPPLPPARPGFDADVFFLDPSRRFKTANYRQTERERAILGRKISELAAKGYWAAGSTRYAVPILLVRKPGKPGDSDADYRIVSDWRSINAATTVMANTLRPCSEAFGRLGRATIFSRFDLRSGFDCLRVSPEFQKSVGVLANNQLYQVTTLPQGFHNSSTIFQNFMNAVLSGDLTTNSHQPVLDRINSERAARNAPLLYIPKDLHPYVVSYIDDILVASDDAEQHAAVLRLLLARLADNHLYLNARKMDVGTTSTTFLGFEVGQGRMAVPPERIRALTDYPAPTTAQQLSSFLGKINYLRIFIPDCPIITARLQAVLLAAKATKSKFRLDEAAQAEFEALKQRLTSLPVLQLPDPSKLYYLSTDASDLALGAVLWQRRDDGQLGPVGYWSRRVTDPERRAQLKSSQGQPHCNELECLAALCAMKHFDMYLKATSSPFILLTDSSFLYRMMTSAEISAKHRRWLEAFADYNFLTYHLAGDENGPADLLSRTPEVQVAAIITRAGRKAAQATTESSPHSETGSTRQDATSSSEEPNSGSPQRVEAGPTVETSRSTPVSTESVASNGTTTISASADSHSPAQTVTNRPVNVPMLPAHIKDKVVAEYAADNFFADVQRALNCPPGDPLAQHHHRRRFFLQDGVIYLNTEDTARICVPQGEGRRLLLLEMHRDRAMNHPGVKAQLRHLRLFFFWPDMTKSVEQLISSCAQCMMNKGAHRQPSTYYQPSMPFPETFYDIHVDLITSLPPATSGTESVDSIFTMVDRFSRFTLLEAVPITITSLGLVEVLQSRVVSTFGVIRRIYSDRDVRLQTTFQTLVKERWGSDVVLTTAAHPQSNGLAERTNAMVTNFLRNYCSVHKNDWPRLLLDAQTAINNHFNSTIGMSPFFCVYGFDYRTKLRAALTSADASTDQRSVANTLHALRLEVLMNILNNQEQLAAQINASIIPTVFKVGDWVKVRSFIIRDPESRAADVSKLSAKWSGPFKIVQSVAPGAYRLELPPLYRAHPVINVEHLQPFLGDASGPGFAVDDHGDVMQDMYLVHDILDHKVVNGRYLFLTRWAGYHFPRDGGWCPKEYFVGRDFINTIFKEYVDSHQLPKHLLSTSSSTASRSAAPDDSGSTRRGPGRPPKPRAAVSAAIDVVGILGLPAHVQLPLAPHIRARRPGRPRLDSGSLQDPDVVDPADHARQLWCGLLRQELLDQYPTS